MYHMDSRLYRLENDCYFYRTSLPSWVCDLEVAKTVNRERETTSLEELI